MNMSPGEGRTGRATNDGTRFLRTIRFDQDRPRTATVHYGHQADYSVHLFQRLTSPTCSCSLTSSLRRYSIQTFAIQVPSLFYRSTKKDLNLNCSLTSNRSKTPSNEKSRIVGLLFEPSIPLSFSFLFSLESSNKLFISSSNHSHQHLYSSKNPTRR